MNANSKTNKPVSKPYKPPISRTAFIKIIRNQVNQSIEEYIGCDDNESTGFNSAVDSATGYHTDLLDEGNTFQEAKETVNAILVDDLKELLDEMLKDMRYGIEESLDEIV